VAGKRMPVEQQIVEIEAAELTLPLAVGAEEVSERLKMMFVRGVRLRQYL
jgi:hypothetical protein